jgi:hypothetical protein
MDRSFEICLTVTISNSNQIPKMTTQNDLIAIFEQKGKKYGIRLTPKTTQEDTTPPSELPDEGGGNNGGGGYEDREVSFSLNYQGGYRVEYIYLPTTESFTALQEGTWFTVSPMSGYGDGELVSKAITFSAPANTTMTPKTGTVTIISNSKTYIYHITQGVSGEILSTDLENPIFNIDSIKTIQVTSNTTWKYYHQEQYDNTWTLLATYSGNQSLTIGRSQFANYNGNHIHNLKLVTLSGNIVIQMTALLFNNISG